MAQALRAGGWTRALVGGVLTAWALGCAPVSRWDVRMDALMRQQELRDASPETSVWVENQAGEPIRRVGMSISSAPGEAGNKRSYSTNWTREITIDGEPQKVWGEKYPDPFVLEQFKVSYDGTTWAEHPLHYRCLVGEKVALVVGSDGRVSIRPGEAPAPPHEAD
jgi:hypothetical protein